MANGPGGYANGSFTANAPHKSVKNTSRQVALYKAYGSSNLHVNLHELVLAPELSFKICDRLQVGISVGPTLNLIDTDFETNVWWVKGNKSFKSYHANDSSLITKLGVASQVAVKYDITKRLYLEAAASYRYVPTANVSAGLGSAALDVSAWQTTIGAGLRF
jgi:opacity protein-like surface antigen